MCEYCLCTGNNHDYMCPNYNEPEDEPEKVECCCCSKKMYAEDDDEYVKFPNGDIVCNSCQLDYFIERYCEEDG